MKNTITVQVGHVVHVVGHTYGEDPPDPVLVANMVRDWADNIIGADDTFDEGYEGEYR